MMHLIPILDIGMIGGFNLLGHANQYIEIQNILSTRNFGLIANFDDLLVNETQIVYSGIFEDANSCYSVYRALYILVLVFFLML